MNGIACTDRHSDTRKPIPPERGLCFSAWETTRTPWRAAQEERSESWMTSAPCIAISTMAEALKMRSLLNEIEEPLEEFDDKLFHELVKGIEINKQDEMTVTFLGGLKFTELI